jgi:crotonobetainyl-CoA:carnitine CoA-transferase CaiB-like acyl-CoA transferase
MGIGAETVISAAPLLGQHSDEVLGEHGLDAGEIAKLRQAGVI